MNRTLALASLGLLILSLGGCSAGKDYWLVYKQSPNTIPAATYQGYYSSDIGTKIDNDIEGCVRNIKDPNKTLQDCGDGITSILAKKPPLTDDDQAKVVVSLDMTMAKELECEIKQTKITRAASPVYDGKKELAEAPEKPAVYFCDLHVTDAGGMRLDYTVKPQTKGEPTKPVPSTNGSQENPPGGPSPNAGSAPIPTPKSTTGTEDKTTTIKSAVVNDSIEVHTLYRFRVLVGPVYSSISDSKDRTYTAKAHAGGTSYVASDAKGNPVHAAAFLKYYWNPRDVYDTKFCLRDKNGAAVSKIGDATLEKSFLECLGRINPIVGLSISENPLENVYVGGSLDILPGLDIVGGVHWSSVQTLSGGFAQGQIVPNGTIVPTEQRFLPGWFLGIAVDTGVAGTWISKATTSLFK